MAAYPFVSTLFNSSPRFQPIRRATRKTPTSVTAPRLVQCGNVTKTADSAAVSRGSGNYEPCIWDIDRLFPLRDVYVGEAYKRQFEKLKEDVKMILYNTVKPLDQLELVDVLQRLGLAYHFEEVINSALNEIYKNNDRWDGKDLHATALEFRLLRQHGYHVDQGVFERFTGTMGSFKEGICEDVKGMLSLYEASYFAIEDESIMEDAWLFTSEHLKNVKMDVDLDLAMQVSHALELPLHWRMPRLEARWFIDVYERRGDPNPVLLQLAKLDFNIVQGFYQEELRDISSWWKKIGLGDKMSFARDRLVESYLWTVGIAFEPQNGYCRTMLARSIALITVIDDIYDVYGTLDELELFTDAIERWDINEMKQLPDYMKLCFLAFFNTVNEMAYDIFKEHGLDVLSHLKKAWLGLVKSYLVEARWYHSGYKPTLKEYMSNGWVSITGPVIAVLAYLSVTKSIRKEAIEFLEGNPEILYWSSVIFRLSDDCGTSTDELKRGDVPKSIQCHMYETGASEAVSREHVRDLMRKTWKKVNRYRVAEDSPLPKSFIEIMLNLVRTAHCMYQHGDGHGIQGGETKDRVLSLLVEPIHL